MTRNNLPASTASCRPSAARGRRKFLKLIGGASAATILADLPSSRGVRAAGPAEVGLGSSPRRASRAYEVRRSAALYEKNLPLPAQPTNGDEEAYPNHIAGYSKGLPHNALGEVEADAYGALLRALASGEQADFDAIPLGGAAKLVNPQSAFAFELEGADSHHLGTPAPPAFSSEGQGAEMVELYWLALTRDVPFSQYGDEPLTAAAADDLRRFSRLGGVTAPRLFRGETGGDLEGPYLSQFLWKPIPYGQVTLTQKSREPIPGDDHLTDYSQWLRVQNGGAPETRQTLGATPRFICCGRDLAEWVHRDFTYQAFLSAALILSGYGAAALDDANPYKSSTNQAAFATFGPPHVLDLVARVANCALKAAWYQKWSLHRRLRPEMMAGRVHNRLAGAASYPIHPKLLDSRAVAEVFRRTGTHLLPAAYPEGCPAHPSYPAGHAAISGACVTVLKAFYNESFTIPDPVVATDDGSTLAPYGGALTVGGELNKLAANVSLGRDTAGVHYRSDGVEGMRLGEAVAISVLTDLRECFNERFGGFSLTKFDGTAVVI